MMPFLLAEYANLKNVLPLYLCAVGSHEQKQIIRPEGYPAQQLFLCRSGRGSFVVNDEQRIVLSSGEAMLLPANLGHVYTPDPTQGAWELGFIAFDGETAKPMLDALTRFHLQAVPCVKFKQLWAQLEGLWQLISHNGENAYWEASRQLYGLLITLLEGEPSAERKVMPRLADGDNRDALQSAIEVIHNHYHERLTITNVARSVGYSVQHFHRLFLGQFGVTPQQYIIQLRMLRSVQLFRDQPGITVDKVAQQLGLETSYFIRLFKRHYGSTPKQYFKRQD
ncbi:AraC family transcriptional regulator [Paenibacillus sp. HB172176]|uniref:helix-turn-helix transcriptional regulator n=1 Tax=Paenibacillus sp. HB172176 TaxID=2493690 RepID=UPI00143C4FD3|nr:AraC family transcriptional regulator [Paenibacillus sp. HB172176]